MFFVFNLAPSNKLQLPCQSGSYCPVPHSVINSLVPAASPGEDLLWTGWRQAGGGRGRPQCNWWGTASGRGGSRAPQGGTWGGLRVPHRGTWGGLRATHGGALGGFGVPHGGTRGGARRRGLPCTGCRCRGWLAPLQGTLPAGAGGWLAPLQGYCQQVQGAGWLS